MAAMSLNVWASLSSHNNGDAKARNSYRRLPLPMLLACVSAVLPLGFVASTSFAQTDAGGLNGGSLTSYKASASGGQGIVPSYAQRASGIGFSGDVGSGLEGN